jgi:IgA-specific serine endopeptidase
MFGDARSLWSTATNAFATINENISTALEKIDAEIDAQDRPQPVNDVDYMKTDLDAYKELLDDAQMQHFELSKQSRILLAEKEAEIQMLKSQLGTPGTADGKSEKAGVDMTDLKYQKLLAEKLTLEASLSEIQEQLRRAVRDQNECSVIKKTHSDLLARFQSVKSDLADLKAEADARDKQKGETIDNLVAEYSKLAAETELYQQQADQRVAEVLKENEILVTKMHALEHCITELADRTVSPSPLQFSSASSIATTGIATSSRLSSRGDLQSAPTGGAADLELKETRSKNVNLQFDVREKEAEIARLKAALAAASAVSVESSPVKAVLSSGVTADTADAVNRLREETARCEELARKLQKLQHDYDNQVKDVARLNTEKKEADNAGRNNLEQFKQMREQYEALVRQQKSAADAGVAGASAATAELQALQAEVAALKTQLAAADEGHRATLAAVAEERTALVAKYAGEAAALQSAHEHAALGASGTSAEHERIVAQLRGDVASLNAQMESISQAHTAALTAAEHDAASQLTVVKAELSAVTAQLAQRGEELAATKAAHEAQLQASLSGGDAERQQLVSGYAAQITALQGEVATLQGEVAEKSSQMERLRAEATAASAESSAKLEQLARDLQRAQGELSTAQAEIASLTATSSQAAGAQDQALTEQRAEAQRLQQELRAAVEAVDSEKTRAAAAVQALEQQLVTLKQERSEALLDKDVTAGKLAQKVEELAAVRAEYEEKLQASLSGSDAARQAMVADYVQQITALQADIVSANETAAERDSQIRHLQGECSTAQAEVTKLTETVTTLSAQLAASAQSIADLNDRHKQELHEKDVAADAALEAERAHSQEQLRSCEESIGVLRDSHREELLSELDAQRKQLSEEHGAAQDQALMTAAAAAQEAQQAALVGLKQQLDQDFAQREEAARTAAAEAQNAAIAVNTAALQADKEAALSAQAAANAEALAAALAGLTVEKDATHSAAMESLRQEKKQELEAALAECRAAAAALLESTKADYDQRITALNAQIDALKAELASIDARYAPAR